MDKKHEGQGNVKWIFTKYLIDRHGSIVGRSEPTTPMSEVREEVEKLR